MVGGGLTTDSSKQKGRHLVAPVPNIIKINYKEERNRDRGMLTLGSLEDQGEDGSCCVEEEENAECKSDFLSE